jgi:hypothetical protein
MSQLDRAMAELRGSSKKLNEITDLANGLVRQVEEFLNKECSLGVCASVRVDTTVDEFTGETFYTALAYARVGGSFRIAVVRGGDADPEAGSLTAWAECTRETKLTTVAKLPDLVLEVAKQVQSDAEAAWKSVSAVANSLSGLLGKEGR